MNKKIMPEATIAVIPIASVGLIAALKTTIGDDAIKLPSEEGIEKTLNLQEENERGESAEDEAIEYGEK